METCVNTTNNTKRLAISSDELKWIRKVRALAIEYPDLVSITRQPKDNDGCIVAYFPAQWLKINPPRRLSEEAREKAAERMSLYRKNRAKNSVVQEDEEVIDLDE